MKLVVIESPFAGDVPANIAYGKRCIHDCLARGEAPYASHLFFTQDGILNDDIPGERELGMEAGFAWGDAAELTVVYMDRGISNGMLAGIARAEKAGRTVEYRYLDIA